MEHKVYAVFGEKSGLADKPLTIKGRNHIWHQVETQLSTAESDALIGVKDSTRTTWID